MIQFCRDFMGMGYLEACDVVGELPKMIDSGLTKLAGNGKKRWTPKHFSPLPSDAWADNGDWMVDCAHDFLLHRAEGGPGKRFLGKRGVHPLTAEKYRLGWWPETTQESRRDWGLKPDTNKSNPDSLWLPRGLVVSNVSIDKKGNPQLSRITIRRTKKDSAEFGPRYYMLPGSSTQPMVLGDETVRAWVIVESELDAILLAQELEGIDEVGVIALRSVTTRPDSYTHELLGKADLILIALDSDVAGKKQTWTWWVEQYRKARPWPIPEKYGKDPGEAKMSGLNLRSWVLAGMQRNGFSTEDF